MVHSPGRQQPAHRVHQLPARLHTLDDDDDNSARNCIHRRTTHTTKEEVCALKCVTHASLPLPSIAFSTRSQSRSCGRQGPPSHNFPKWVGRRRNTTTITTRTIPQQTEQNATPHGLDRALRDTP